jgi:PAS domain S-box-containing protein
VTALRYQSGLLVVRGLHIVYASDGAAALAGYAPAALQGKPVLDLVAPEERERVLDRYERRRRGEPVPAEYETFLVRADGTRRAVELHVESRAEDVVVEFHDLSALAARRPRLEGLAALGVAIQRELTREAVHAHVREALPGVSLGGALLASVADGLRVEWSAFPPEVQGAFEEQAGCLTGLVGRWTPFARAIWRDGAAFSDDWASVASAFIGEPLGARARAMAASVRLSRAVGVRIEERAGTRSHLVLVGEWLRREDVAAVRLFGAQIAAALDAAGTIAELSRRNDELAAVNRVGGLLGEAGDLESFFERAEEIVRAASGCRGFVVFVLDPQEGQLVRAWDSGIDPEIRARLERLPGTGVLAEVLRERQPRVVAFDEGGAWRADLRRMGYDSVAWVPLVARSMAIGAVAVGFPGGPEGVTPHLELLGAVGAHFASAVESHGMVADLRRRLAELTLLNDVAVASAQLDPVVLLESALRRMCETFQADGGAAFLREGDGLALVASRAMSADGARRAARLRPGEGLAGLAFQRVAPVRASEVQGDPTTTEICRIEGTRSAIGIPLVAKTHAAVGSIVLARRTARPVTDEEVALLSAVGFQLGVAVENARVFVDVRRRLADLEAVHGLALRIFGNAAGDVSALLDDACHEMARALACRGGVVALLGADGRKLSGVAGWGAPFDPTRIELPLAQDQLAQDAIRLRAPSWSEDATHDPRSALYGRADVAPMAVLAVPLTSRQATRGVLYLWDDPGRAFSDPELALANALAGELAVGLENAELYAEARRRVEELSLLNEVGRTVAGSLDLDHVLAEGLAAACRLLDANHGQVILHDPIRGTLRVAATSGGDRLVAEQDSADLCAGGVSWRAVRERRVIAVEDAQADPEVNPGLRARYGVRALLVAPMLLRGEPLGVVVVSDASRTRRFQPAEVERLTAVANQLAVALENARLYAEASGRLHELSTVIDVARVVSSSLDLEEVLTAGAEHLKQTLQASACTILLDDYRRRELHRAASRGPPIGEETVPLAGPSLARDALEARAPVTGRTPSADGEAALLAVPLHVRDQPVGVALVAGAGGDRTFSPGELARAMAIASQLAVAVDNARLYSETRRRAEELGVLHEVGRSLVATLDFEQVLDAGARNLARMVDAPRALIALADGDGAELQVRAQWGLPGSLLGARIPVKPGEPSLAAAVFDRREPIAIEDARSDPRVRHDLDRDPAVRAALGLPLVVRDRYIGSAVIVETRGPRRFGAAEVERATAVANQLAVAADNARLYEDLRRSYAELAQAQRQLIQQERLAALGELSAVVAHEVRNPLGVIFNSLGSLRRLLRPEGDARMLLDIVGEEADRLNRIVGDLLDFARPSTPTLRPEALERVVDEAVAVALAQNAPAVEVHREFAGGLPPVPIDARLVRQAVVNVAVNAVQAMPRGGRLTVRTRRDGDSALVEIEDTGAGIPEEIRDRMFEPFFTTKASGTGLGLAVVKRIVDGHGGAISVRSGPGAGAAFALRFPLHPRAGEDNAVVETEATIG